MSEYNLKCKVCNINQSEFKYLDDRQICTKCLYKGALNNLRDKFAMAALRSYYSVETPNGTGQLFTDIAANCYEQADVMMKQRELKTHLSPSVNQRNEDE